MPRLHRQRLRPSQAMAGNPMVLGASLLVLFGTVASRTSSAFISSASKPVEMHRPALATGAGVMQAASAASQPAAPAPVLPSLTCLLAAAALTLTAARSRPGRRVGKELRVVVTRSLPVSMPTVAGMTAAAPSCTQLPETADLLSFVTEDAVAGLPSLVVEQEVRPLELLAAGSMSAQGRQRRSRQREERSRRERRRVGAKLLQQTKADPRPQSFEPSKVPIKMQRGLQLRSFPGSAGARESKRQAKARGPASCLDIGLQSFNIKSMAFQRDHTPQARIE